MLKFVRYGITRFKFLQKTQKKSQDGQQPPSIIYTNINTFVGTNSHKHLHQYVHDQQSIQAKKENIDYETINRFSTGKIMFRQYIFQEKVETTMVSAKNCQMEPTGAWTSKQMKKLMDQQQADNRDIFELQRDSMLTEHIQDLNNAFKAYYQSIGKKNLKFILSQEIQKLKYLSENEYKDIIDKIRKFQKKKQGKLQ